ncbi:hypothetical protein [Streptomyces collinus]|uniref:aromatic-ring hydroxylase C-terminal domain-containing protein n=1 Tax=Streptomyces TaxID=1883 RepID=UPI00380D779F
MEGRHGKEVVLDFSLGRALQVASKAWEGRIRYAGGPVRDDLGLGAVLVRPDGVVARASAPAPNRDTFEQAAARWFGPSRNQGPSSRMNGVDGYARAHPS